MLFPGERDLMYSAKQSLWDSPEHEEMRRTTPWVERDETKDIPSSDRQPPYDAVHPIGIPLFSRWSDD
jgi:hypothetical protein